MVEHILIVLFKKVLGHTQILKWLRLLSSKEIRITFVQKIINNIYKEIIAAISILLTSYTTRHNDP